MDNPAFPLRYAAFFHVVFFAVLLLAVMAPPGFSEADHHTRAGLLLPARLILLGLGTVMALWTARRTGGHCSLPCSMALTGAFAAQLTWVAVAAVSRSASAAAGLVPLLKGVTVMVAMLLLAADRWFQSGKDPVPPRPLLNAALVSVAVGAGAGLLASVAWTRNTPVQLSLGAVCLGLLLVAAWRLKFACRPDGLKSGLFLFGLYGTLSLTIPPFLPALWADQARALLTVLDCSALALIHVSLFATALGTVQAGAAQAVHTHAEAARRDALTGLFNRRTLDNVGPGLFAGAHRLEQPISLLMIDIDHFKPVNDIYGHPAGDAVLRQFAQILATQVRVTDLVARYGGEEFAAMLPGAPLAPALRLAEKIRAAVEAAEFDIGDGKTLRVTTSIGVATAFPGEMHDFRELVDMADKNLYRAKRSGRNRVMSTPLVTGPDEV